MTSQKTQSLFLCNEKLSDYDFMNPFPYNDYSLIYSKVGYLLLNPQWLKRDANTLNAAIALIELEISTIRHPVRVAQNMP